MSIPKYWLRQLDAIAKEFSGTPAVRDVIELACKLGGVRDRTSDRQAEFKRFVLGELIAKRFEPTIVYVGPEVEARKERDQLREYARSMETLVSTALRRPRLAWALFKPFEQLEILMLAISGLTGSDDEMRNQIAAELGAIRIPVKSFLSKVRQVEQSDMETVARKLGRADNDGEWINPQKGHFKVTKGMLVEIIAKGPNPGSKKPLRLTSQGYVQNHNEFLGLLALSDEWHFLPVHRSESDDTPHTTLYVSGMSKAFHVRLYGDLQLMAIVHLDFKG